LDNAGGRRPAFISKLGFDRQLTPNLPVRLTGSNYTIRKSPADTLYGGDRAGWFINKYLLLKSEYAVQSYKNFAVTDIRNGGRFQGPVVGAELGF
jgi:hypothetical protein